MSAQAEPLANLKLENAPPVLKITRDSYRHLYLNGVAAFAASGKRCPSNLNFRAIEALIKRGYVLEIKDSQTRKDITIEILSRVLSKRYRATMRALTAEDLTERLRAL